jgi:hypothetical protein
VDYDLCTEELTHQMAPTYLRPGHTQMCDLRRGHVQSHVTEVDGGVMHVCWGERKEVTLISEDEYHAVVEAEGVADEVKGA